MKSPQVGEVWWTPDRQAPWHEYKCRQAIIRQINSVVGMGVYGYTYDIKTEEWGTLLGFYGQGEMLFETKEDLMAWFKVQNKRTMDNLLKQHGPLLEAWRRGELDE